MTRDRAEWTWDELKEIDVMAWKVIGGAKPTATVESHMKRFPGRKFETVRQRLRMKLNRIRSKGLDE